MAKETVFRPIDILLVEDNPGDADLAKEALADSKIANTLHIVQDGEAATNFLYKRKGYRQAPRPDGGNQGGLGFETYPGGDINNLAGRRRRA